MRTELVGGALKAVDAARGGLTGAIFHLDHGSQASPPQWGLWARADSALAESFNAALKRKVLQDNTCEDDAATCCRQVLRGWRATTPNEGTPTAVISAPPPTRRSTHPLRCPKPRNRKSRVHSPGSSPPDPYHGTCASRCTDYRAVVSRIWVAACSPARAADSSEPAPNRSPATRTLPPGSDSRRAAVLRQKPGSAR